MVHQQQLPFDSHEPQVRFDNYLGVQGLTYWPGFLTIEQQRHLLREIDQREWLTDLKRRVQHYGYRYDYRARTVDPSMYLGKLPDFALEIAVRLHEVGLMANTPDQVIVNEYMPGQGITPHVDCKPCFASEIATISLGSTCKMDLTDSESALAKHIRLELGSCLVFSNEARYCWKHGIKARKADDGVLRGRRVSITFRKVILSNP